MADWPDFSATDLLRLPVQHGVDFVVVGGIAMVIHGSARLTQDLDICFASDPANLSVMGTALSQAGAQLRGIDEDAPFVPDARTLARLSIVTLQTRYGPIDLLRDPVARPPTRSCAGEPRGSRSTAWRCSSPRSTTWPT